jgi:hypothetical protein
MSLAERRAQITVEVVEQPGIEKGASSKVWSLASPAATARC